MRWVFNSLVTEEAEEAERQGRSPTITQLVPGQLRLTLSDVSLPRDYLMLHSVSSAAAGGVQECDAK